MIKIIIIIIRNINKSLDSQSNAISELTKDGVQTTNSKEICKILSAQFASNFSPVNSISRESVPLLMYPNKTVNDEYLLNITIENVY